jgi:hypothetical protein
MFEINTDDLSWDDLDLEWEKIDTNWDDLDLSWDHDLSSN